MPRVYSKCASGAEKRKQKRQWAELQNSMEGSLHKYLKKNEYAEVNPSENQTSTNHKSTHLETTTTIHNLTPTVVLDDNQNCENEITSFNSEISPAVQNLTATKNKCVRPEADRVATFC